MKLCFRCASPRAEGLLKALKRDGITKLIPVTLTLPGVAGFPASIAGLPGNKG